MEGKILKIQPKKWHRLSEHHFYDVRNGQKSDIKTKIKIKFSDENLKIKFKCFENPYLDYNGMFNNNEPLFNQEVFELFISGGSEDPENYLEFEINPNGATWLGKITNRKLNGADLTVSMIDEKIDSSVSKKKDSWKGQFTIPLKMISEQKTNEYRFNFYRIVATKKPDSIHWQNSKDNALFLALFSTDSGEEPAFHKPKKFGFIRS